MRARFPALIGQLDREAWIRFFIALGGLSLAFAAAMFSTVFRESGNLWMTAISASAALLIAGLIALYTVPYLAKRVAVESVRDVFDYDVTREGVVYLVLCLIIGVAALNTGNNLLFIIVSALLAAIVVSGVASAGILRYLDLDVSTPEHLFAGRAVLGRVTLRNTRRAAPAFSVSVVPPRERGPRKRWLIERSYFGFPFKRPPHRQWFQFPDLNLHYIIDPPVQSAIFQGSIYFPYIPPKSAVSSDLELRFERRGRYVQDGFGLATKFPFSFLKKTRRIELRREILVYPSVDPTDEFFEVLPMITGEFETFVRGRGYDLYRIRDYMPEDSARHVDWKATARSGTVKVREFTREDERKLRIVFDNPAPGMIKEPTYENAIALSASLAWHFAGVDTDLSFAAPGYRGGEDVYDILEYLALVQPGAGKQDILEHLPVSEVYNLIFTARARGTIPRALWDSSYFVFLEDRTD